ncbi:MAG: DUF5329 family protein [Pseudomonadales bacterium]|nr:DUF5329 family protein [Pseudomonadales bacterium]MBO6563318.1 DUF5329 family protein [Pseudomonadales bacterium]MBO6595897.1 DUF5329 family protein [Pseudomonadales bacterium]MBO6656762.1 DUF5329 family protein [Pseudomonadales bacterium]MBO6822381.1 DUF5329 family protein [Pseudomonadales bacterium]
MKNVLCLLLLAVLVTPGVTYATGSLASDIKRLIQAVEISGCTFMRNGKAHASKESGKHISRKYAHFEDDIDSIESFVALTATKSLISGKPYVVQCENTVTSSSEWMLNKAEELGLES